MTQTPADSDLCRNPYRAMFPLGWLMAWFGIAPWILFAWVSGVTYPRTLHSLVLIQGVLTPFAAGFLFMVMPRRLESASPRPWQMALAIAVPPVHFLLVWQEMLGWAHALWAVEALVLLLFAGLRVLGLRAKRRGPAAFVWVPIGLLFGLVGAVLLGFDGFSPGKLGPPGLIFAWLLLTQGLFLCLVMGIGGLFLPLVTQKEGTPDADVRPDATRRRLAHGVVALGILITFALEALDWPSTGRLMRAALALLVLLISARIYRLPTVQGTQRKLIWLASWSLPLGLALAAANPAHPHIGLHLFFIGGIGLITLSVALHVTLAHSDGQELVFRPVWRVRIFGALIFLALACRILAEIDLIRRLDWIAGGAALFLLALVPWGQLVLVRALVRRKPEA